MEVTGKIKVVEQTKEIGTGGFKKRDVVVTTDETYPQHILIQFVQDKCDSLDNYKVGESVVIGINLRGREWTNPQGETVYFNTIQGWRIVKQDVSKQSPEPQSAVDAYQAKQVLQVLQASNEEEPDDLPF